MSYDFYPIRTSAFLSTRSAKFALYSSPMSRLKSALNKKVKRQMSFGLSRMLVLRSLKVKLLVLSVVTVQVNQLFCKSSAPS